MRMVSGSNCPPQACKNDLSVTIHIGCLDMWRCTGDTRRGGGEKVCLVPRDISRADQHTDTHSGHTRQ